MAGSVKGRGMGTVSRFLEGREKFSRALNKKIRKKKNTNSKDKREIGS